MPPILWRVCLIAVLAAVAVAGIDWGLPSADREPLLFYARQPWDGKTLAAYDAERGSATQGADVDRDPLPPSADPVVLTATDADRAALVRRYRLFSHQPDEMITFMALQQMGPRQLDPRLYQYGGVWVYPVGGLLAVAGKLGLIELKTDKAFYYDHPDAFGRFYVVARLYTLAAYVLAMATAGMVVRRLTDDDFAAAIGAAVVGVLPVVFACAHDAKPHLGGVALVLATVLAGARWLRTGRTADAALCGTLAGLAAGMVLSAAVAAVVPLTMVFLPRPHGDDAYLHDSPARRLGAFAMAATAGVFAFVVTNPFVVLHAVHGDAVLTSNLRNTQAMYGLGEPLAMLTGAARRLLDALSWPAVAVSAGGLVVAVTGRRRVSALSILLIVPCVLVFGQFVLLAADKPPEYARFALLPAVGFGVLAVWAVSTVRRTTPRLLALTALPPAVFIAGTLPYQQAFAADTGERNTRDLAGDQLRQIGGGTLQVYAEPAPYAVPPVDVWAWRVVLSRPGDAPIGDAIARTVDDPAVPSPAPLGYRRLVFGTAYRPAPITWADKPVEVLVRE